MDLELPKKLLLELHHSKFMPKFNEDLFQQIIKQINEQIYPNLFNILRFFFHSEITKMSFSKIPMHRVLSLSTTFNNVSSGHS